MPMRIRFTTPTFIALLALASPAAGQSAVGGRATMTVAEVLRLEVVEAVDSVRLEVRANRAWRVEATLVGGSGESWAAGIIAAGEPGRTTVALSRRRLAEVAGAPASAAPRFTLSGR